MKKPFRQVSAGDLHRVASEAAATVPPAVVRGSRRTALINIKVGEELAVALAVLAKREGATQKQLIVRALRDQYDLPVDDLDLQDRSARRRAA